MKRVEIVLIVVLACGAIGAYAMSLSIVTGAKRAAGWTAVPMFIFPGMVYVIGYSALGFLWGLMVWRLFAEDGPVGTVVAN